MSPGGQKCPGALRLSCGPESRQGWPGGGLCPGCRVEGSQGHTARLWGWLRAGPLPRVAVAPPNHPLFPEWEKASLAWHLQGVLATPVIPWPRSPWLSPLQPHRKWGGPGGRGAETAVSREAGPSPTQAACPQHRDPDGDLILNNGKEQPTPSSYRCGNWGR